MHTPMPVEELALAYASVASGEHTTSSQVGKAITSETSDGQKQQPSGFSFSSLQNRENQGTTTRSMAIMKEWSKGGGMEEAKTDPQTAYLNAFTALLKNTNSTSTPDMYPVHRTQLMHHHKENMAPKTFSFHQYPSPVNSSPSLSTMMHHSPNPSSIEQVLANILYTWLKDLGDTIMTTSQHSNTTSNKKQNNSPVSPQPGLSNTQPPMLSGSVRWPLMLPQSSSNNNPHPYPAHLPLNLSNLHPHCLAREQLVLWKPINHRKPQDHQGCPIDVSDEDLSWILLVITGAYVESTLQSYAAGLLNFHVFCDSRNTPEDQHGPASPGLISLWISTIAGTYSGAAIRNFVHGVQTWHIIHRMDWCMNKEELDAVLWRAERLTPDLSKKKKCQPYTIPFIEAILEALNLNDPFDAAVATCLTTTFYSGACVGEFTVPKLSNFNPDKHITHAHMRTGQDQNGFQTTIFHLPCTKSAPDASKDVFWAVQTRTSDPDRNLKNHFHVNDPAPCSHLFSYKACDSHGKDIHKPLTKRRFIERLATAAKSKNMDPLQGHGIRISSTLEYLLRGMPFDILKATFRWKSDAFLTYLHKHAEIMAPYMQPELHRDLIQYTMPPPTTQPDNSVDKLLFFGVSMVAGCVALLLVIWASQPTMVSQGVSSGPKVTRGDFSPYPLPPHFLLSPC
ncbi:tyrosine recombinase [Moniliophthora roreri MCA 2997]|uniref:Tyrosine recombinase n=2 Tax=Moniliophthora roreri TaxID=221103 RepID=V2WZA4_MONRO|nr:tyrosine recombinase [Moniliophthora roreri MCA 2997]